MGVYMYSPCKCGVDKKKHSHSTTTPLPPPIPKALYCCPCTCPECGLVHVLANKTSLIAHIREEDHEVDLPSLSATAKWEEERFNCAPGSWDQAQDY
jgi:hypothetical protein